MQCLSCSHKNKIETSSSHNKSGKPKPNAYDINTKATLASLHAGVGETHLKSILSVMNILPMSRAIFKARERETGKAVESVAKVLCEEVIGKEKQQLINSGAEPDENNLVSVPCSYDMGWQKRGRGFNSNTGHAATMSHTSGKIFDYGTKTKKCQVCEYAQRTNTKAKVHDCRKNHKPFLLKPWSQYQQLHCLERPQSMALSTPHILVMMIQPLSCISINKFPMASRSLVTLYTLNVHSPQGCTTLARWLSSRNAPYCQQKLLNTLLSPFQLQLHKTKVIPLQ